MNGMRRRPGSGEQVRKPGYGRLFRQVDNRSMHEQIRQL